MATVGTPESIAQLKNEIENVEEQIAQLIQGVGDNEPLKVVVLDGLTVSKIVKHCKESLPVLVTGQLLGLDVGSTLEVTNCFPFPSAGTEEEADNDYAVEYQIEMMKCLRKAKMDNNTVGWYHSTYLGSFLSESIIETQFNYQDAIPKSVVVVYDPLKSSQGALSLQAYRLTDAFMELYRVQDFTQESLERAKLSFNDVFEEIPIQIKNAHLNSAFLWEVEDSASWGARGLDFDRLDLSTNPFLEKNLEFLVEYIDELVGEQNKLQNHYRAVQRQQQQQTAWYAKRKSENEARRRSGLTELPEEDPDNPIFKNIQPPSRLEGLLITNQINSYCQQINQFAGQSFAKLFLYNGLRKDASGNSI